MGTIAEKLSYLNTTKEKIRDSINLTGANIGTSDTFRSYASKLKKGYIDIINNGIDTLYNNFPKVSGIGSNLSLTPTYEAPMKLNEIQGDTLQDGTPTPDTPIEIQSVTGLQNVEVCGKNLLNSSQESYTLPANENYSQAIGEIYLEANTKYYFSYNVDNDSASNTRSTMYLQIGGGNRIYQNAVANNNLTKGRKVWEYTPTESAIYNVGYWLHTSNVAVSINNFMISTSTATTYEAYSGNNYEVNLGKNLFDETKITSVTNGTYSDGIITSNIMNDNPFNLSVFNSLILSAGTYYISADIRLVSGSTTFSKMNDGIKNGTIISYPTLSNEFQRYIISQTYNSTTNIQRLLFQFTNSTNVVVEIKNIQIEKGTQATSYSPYFTPIELNKIGDYQDRIYKDNGKWYVEKNTRKLELAIANMNNAEDYPGWRNQTQLYNDTYNGIIGGDLLNYTRYYTNISSVNYTGVRVNFTNSSDPLLYLRKGDFNKTQTEWKTNYPNLIFTIVYGIKQPEITEITNTELIEDLETLYTAKSQDGTTNISITSEDLEMILNVSALKGEV